MYNMVIKLHYFLWFGSLAGILPYTSVLGNKYSSASASEIGFLYTLLPFVALIAKPVGCSLADRFLAHKQVLVISLLLTLVGYGSLAFAPWFPAQSSWTWWFFCTAVLLANTSMGVVTSMTDSLAMSDASSRETSYGVSRVFGTLGWGILGLAAGGINDHLFTGLPYLLPGIVMFIMVICIDILAILIFFKQSPMSAVPNSDGSLPELESPLRGTNVWCDVVTSFTRFPSLFYYCSVVFMCGFLTAFHWSFFFWFLESIRPQDTLLMGLCLGVQSFVGEVPWFLCSEYIVKKIGFNLSLSLTFLSIGLRYLCYGFLINSSSAYYVLFVELLQGPSFGLFYVVMTAIAQDYSLKTAALKRKDSDKSDSLPEDDGQCHADRTYATMQGLMGAMYEGAGLGAGALIAGLSIDRLGSQTTWISAGSLSLIVCAVTFLLSINVNRGIG